MKDIKKTIAFRLIIPFEISSKLLIKLNELIASIKTCEKPMLSKKLITSEKPLTIKKKHMVTLKTKEIT